MGKTNSKAPSGERPNVTKAFGYEKTKKLGQPLYYAVELTLFEGQVIETRKKGPFYMIEARIHLDAMMRLNVARLMKAVVEEVK